jgi:diguanylate cyclase (GGDEF)-like protein
VTWPETVCTEVERQYRRVATERVAVRFEHWYPGARVWHAIQAYPAEGGGVAVFYRDVTAEKQAAAEREALLVAAREAGAAAERAIAALRASEARFRHQALHDSLTGLANRALFGDRVGHALARAAREGTGAAVLYLDLDGFKALNDALGHAAGDRCLVEAAERLRGAVRADDTVARLGGDEFAVLLEGTHAAAAEVEAVAVAKRIEAALEAPVVHDGRPYRLAASVGIAATGGAAGSVDSCDALLRRADGAMYAAKSRGGRRHVVADRH